MKFMINNYLLSDDGTNYIYYIRINKFDVKEKIYNLFLVIFIDLNILCYY